MPDGEVRIRTFVHGSAEDLAQGLIGYLSVYAGSLILDGITVRRTTDGRIALSFPARTDRAGRRHPLIRPVDDRARQQLERQILKALVGNQEETTS